MSASIGQKILDEIIHQNMVRISYPDPDEAHVFVWNGNCVEQLEALVKDHTVSLLFLASALADQPNNEEIREMLREEISKWHTTIE